MRTPRPEARRALGALLVAWTLAAAVAAVVAVGPALALGNSALAVAGYWDDIEVDLADLDTPLAERTVITAVDGTEIAVLFNENRVPVASLDAISPALRDAVLATEDDEFYEHGPIDLTGTARALVRNGVAGGVVQGGSTITQQYVKLLRANAGQSDATEESLDRKLTELKYAAELEQATTKDEILLGYLNAAYFGNGAYGVRAAAQAYFTTTPDALTLPQAAMLAGLLKNPTGYDPTLRPQAARDRRATVLARMETTGRITPAERTNADATDLSLAPADLPNGCTTSPYPYYCDWVRNVLLTDQAFGTTPEQREGNLARGGFTVRTALDPTRQAAAQAAVDAAFTRDQDQAAAIAVVEPGTGAVPAIAATRDYATTQFNIPVQAMLQPGSTFKPVTLAAAYERGFATTDRLDAPARYTPASMNAPAGGFRNVDGQSRFDADAATAMKFSVNTWFVRLLEQTGTAPVADMAYRLGMTSLDPAERRVGPADASLTLGAFETTPLQLASVYATLAADGSACRPVPVLEVLDTATGERLPAPDAACRQVVSPAVARAVTSALSATAQDGGTAEDVTLDGRAWAGKTGTTNEYGATWFAGYTPTLAAAVWVGDTRGPAYPLTGVTAYGRWEPVLYGSTVAAPVWAEAMTAMHAGVPAATFPPPLPITPWGTQVPDVVGLSMPAARSALGDAGMKPEFPDGAPEDGVVVAQSPAGGSTVTGPVELTVQAGATTVVSRSKENR